MDTDEGGDSPVTWEKHLQGKVYKKTAIKPAGDVCMASDSFEVV